MLDAFRRIVQALRAGDRDAERTTALGVAQLFALSRLDAAPAGSMAELAARTFTDPSSVSVVVAKLVARGLARRTRSAEDGRRFGVEITARGRAALRRGPAPPQERLTEALVAMTPARRRALRAGLVELVDAMGLERDRAALFFTDARPRRSAR